MTDQPILTDLDHIEPVFSVAFAVRCARRVQPLFMPSHDYPYSVGLIVSIEDALDIVERAALGSKDRTSVAVQIAESAAEDARTAPQNLIHKDTSYLAGMAAVQAALAANSAYGALDDAEIRGSLVNNAYLALNYAQNAAKSVIGMHDEATQKAALIDLKKISELVLAARATSDAPITSIDPTNQGPLGDLWSGQTPPSWYEESCESFYNQLDLARVNGIPPVYPLDKVEIAQLIEQSQPLPQISVYFDDLVLSDSDKLLFLEYVSETYRASSSGIGLKIVDGRALTPAMAEVDS